VNQDQVESQLSAMFDGELPVVECELLSRRIDRDENLRARWSRYALIGAAMRSEPVAAARMGFASRVSAALSAESRPPSKRQRRLLWNSALAATLVAAVAGGSITMLRDDASRFDALGRGATAGVATAGVATAASDTALPAAARKSTAPDGALAALPASAVAPGAMTHESSMSHEPWSYVTPAGFGSGSSALRTQLADFMVAHSAYSAPLIRTNLMSVLVSSEDGLGNASDFSRAAVVSTTGHIDAAAVAGARGQ
jgi:negative regulator of sigma E activity